MSIRKLGPLCFIVQLVGKEGNCPTAKIIRFLIGCIDALSGVIIGCLLLYIDVDLESTLEKYVRKYVERSVLVVIFRTHCSFPVDA